MEGFNKLKKVCQEPDKFDKKIQGKEFLLGKYFDGKKNKASRRKEKKITKSKIKRLLRIQQQIVGVEPKRNYSFYKPLNNLWRGYINELIKNEKSEQSLYIKILHSDFHGAEFSIIYSKVDSYIGLEGIIINQTQKCFIIITKDDKTLMILKKEVVLMITSGERHFVVNANFIIFRPTDRIKHKFKSRTAESLNVTFLDEFVKEEH